MMGDDAESVTRRLTRSQSSPSIPSRELSSITPSDRHARWFGAGAQASSTTSSANTLPPNVQDVTGEAARRVQISPQQTREKSLHPDDHHADLIRRQQFYLLKVCRGLMVYGAPNHRLEGYMHKTAEVLGLYQQSFYLPGCMIISFNDSSTYSTDVHIVRCTQSLNLTKLYNVRKVYKDVIHGRADIDHAIVRLDEIMEGKDQFNPWFRVLVYGLASMCIGPVSYSARPIDLPFIFLLGTLLGLAELILAERSEAFARLFEVFMTIIISFVARALGSIKLPNEGNFCFSALCQASLVMILPGFVVTNSALELQNKHMVAGSVRLVYGIIFVLFIAFGITIGSSIYGAIDATANSNTTCTNPWPFWWQIIFVPLFTWAWIIVNQSPWREMPAMILLTTAGWVVNHFASQRFSTNTTISNALAALTIGIFANLYSRFGGGFAAALLHPAIFILVPGSLGANGGLISGIQSANELNDRTSSSNGSALATGQQRNFAMLDAGYSMVEIAIGITVGLAVSVLVVYPISKKKGSGIFSF